MIDDWWDCFRLEEEQSWHDMLWDQDNEKRFQEWLQREDVVLHLDQKAANIASTLRAEPSLHSLFTKIGLNLSLS